MSPTLTRAETLHEILLRVDALASLPAPTLRDCWMGLDLLQRYAETLGEMAEDLPPFDGRVTVKIEGQGVRFENVEAMVNFIIVGVMKHGN